MEHDQHFGGSFNAHKNWKRLRDKHRRKAQAEKRGIKHRAMPEYYRPSSHTVEGSERIVSDKMYALNYDLAFGKISQEEYDKKVSELDLE
tara:strand:+ start:59 stop:328 length:270 start_codon:yes stop_codon:yes gene_type:complete